MQADEIIQQKEWNELNAGDKEILAELASTEQEYNLLKKMLQVSSEEPEDVPLIGKHVRNELHAELPKTKVRSIAMYKYAAAAAVTIAILTSIIFLNKNKTTGDIVKNDTIIKTTEQTAIVHQPAVPANDTLVVSPQKVIPVPKQIIAKVDPAPTQTPTPVDIDPVPQAPVYAAVNTSIKSQQALLDLVTEIY